jgi:RNA polymerase sigma-70 factor (ECF subfamily)
MDPSRTDLSQADDALVTRAQNGDRDAFGELVNRHQRRIWMVCRQYVGAAEADAAAQDSLLKAFTRIGDFDQRAAFSTWLTRIAVNTCVDELRRWRRAPLVDDGHDGNEDSGVIDRIADDSAGPETRSMQRQAMASLEAHEMHLPPRQREIFRLRFYAEMDLEEIAAVLGVHVGTVKTQLHRAVHKLREELGAYR